MRIARYGHLHSGQFSGVCVEIVQIQAVGPGIDLKAAAALARGRDQPVDIELIRLALADQPAGWMGDDRHMRIVHGADDPLRLRISTKVEIVVHGGDHDVEPRKNRVRQVEASVGKNIELNALQQGDSVELLPDALHLVDLLCEPRAVEPMRHGYAPAVIGYGDVFVAPPLRGCGHFGDRDSSVGPVGMNVKVTFDVIERNEIRQMCLLRRRDLAAILAQLGRNEG